MIKRLSETLCVLWDNLYFSIQRLLMAERESTDTIHAPASRVLIVKSPDPHYFKEAIFILRDDLFFSEDGDRRAILREARSAAENYTLSVAGHKKSPLWRAVYFLLGMASAFAALLIL